MKKIKFISLVIIALVVFSSCVLITKKLSSNELKQVYSGKTYYSDDGDAEYTREDGVTFYKTKERGIVSGKWFTKENKICYRYYVLKDDDVYCHERFKKGDSVISSYNDKDTVIILKTGDTENLQKAYHLKEVSDFQEAKKANTIVAYDEFLKKHPNSKHAEEVLVLKEDVFFSQAKKANSVSSSDEFIEKYPNSKHVKEVSFLREKELKKIAKRLESEEPITWKEFDSIIAKVSYLKNKLRNLEKGTSLPKKGEYETTKEYEDRIKKLPEKYRQEINSLWGYYIIEFASWRGEYDADRERYSLALKLYEGELFKYHATDFLSIKYEKPTKDLKRDRPYKRPRKAFSIMVNGEQKVAEVHKLWYSHNFMKGYGKGGIIFIENVSIPIAKAKKMRKNEVKMYTLVEFSGIDRIPYQRNIRGWGQGAKYVTAMHELAIVTPIAVNFCLDSCRFSTKEIIKAMGSH